MSITIPSDLDAAAMALRNWFQSQEIDPHECMIIVEYFIARMILQNATSAADIEEKFDLINTSIRALVSRFRKATP